MRRSLEAAALLLLLLFHGLGLVVPALSEDSFHLDIYPPQLPLSAAERLEHYRAIAAKDILRHRRMSERLHGGGSSERRQAWESSKVPDLMSNTSRFELSMRSGFEYAGVGMYLVTVRIGTPALPFNLALDTANDLTWINCRLRRRRGKHHGRPHVSPVVLTSLGGDSGRKFVRKSWYRPSLSSSWRRQHCSSPVCEKLPHVTGECPAPSSSCMYETTYQDGTTTRGIYGQEKATVALYGKRMAKLPGLVLGCSTFSKGAAVEAHDGVLSLGNSNISFGLHAARRFGGRFSFCLLESTTGARNSSSYLTFGPNLDLNDTASDAPTMETPLIFNNDILSAYGATVTGIYVDGKLLDIPLDVWDSNIVGGGIVVDSGTTITGLVTPVYNAVTTALDAHFSRLPRADILGFEFCYNWTMVENGHDPKHNVTIPKLVVEMDGGARLEPDPKGYVMPEVIPGVACLGFRRMVEGPMIMGNVLMQEHVWEFDFKSSTLRFRKTKCVHH